MTRTRKYRRRRSASSGKLNSNKYVRIVAIIAVVVAVASFYIYQRVWVRNLDAEIKRLEAQNDGAKELLAAVKSEWMTASSIGNIENRVGQLKLCLEPTRPSQNFSLRPQSVQDQSRYAGVLKAIEKLKGNIPLVSSNEADAGELFDEE